MAGGGRSGAAPAKRAGEIEERGIGVREWIKTVFHVHTHYSDDGNASVQDIIDNARLSGVDCVAVTDHDSIEGARKLDAIAPDDLHVIIGEEISTADGHLVGLFLSEQIRPGMSARETAEAIRDQGGLVVVPHPFNRMFGCSLRDRAYEILDLIDVVEIANAQNLSPWPNRRAAAFAKQHDLPGIAGGDVHHRGYLGTSFQWMRSFDGPEGFVASLRSARLIRRAQPISYFARSAYVHLCGRLGLKWPADYGTRANSRRKRADSSPEPAFDA